MGDHLTLLTSLLKVDLYLFMHVCFVFFQQQFSIGVNDVTRVLERMAPVAQEGISPQQPHSSSTNRKGPSVQLQVSHLSLEFHV